MYTVKIEEINKKSKKVVDVREYVLGEADTDAYRSKMGDLADYLYDLDIDFDVNDGDGDMEIDDLLIAISEEEEFESELSDRKCIYRIEAYFA